VSTRFSGMSFRFTTGRSVVAAGKTRSRLVVSGTLPINTVH
jgi:hypothetical protein